MKAALAIACIAAGCSSASSQRRHHEASSASGYARVQAATALDGAAVGPLPEHQRATVMVVFASWCGPCRRELAVLGDLRRIDPEVRIIGLNAYEEWSQLSDQDRLRKFLGENAPWLRVVRADQALLQRFGGVTKVPTVFVYDRNGTLVREFRRTRRAPPGLAELRAAVLAAKRT